MEKGSEKLNWRQRVSPAWTRYSDIVVERGEGCYLFDEMGARYLDFTSGFGVTNTGHCHKNVVNAIKAQTEKLLHGQINIVFHKPFIQLIRELNNIIPRQLDGYFFGNSGAEAVEGAVKLARMATGRTNIIVFQGSFHGRTMGAMALTTSKTVYRAHYQPLMPGIFVAPYPYSYRYGWDPEITLNWCLEELRHLLITQTAPEETAAILVEPILGEGGYIVPPKGFLNGIREICNEHDILLLLDEIQSGFGRTGKWFAFEHAEVVPDILIIAKGMASGLPLSGVIARMDLMDRWISGSHGGTFGGNALACAAAVATIRTIMDEGLVENARVQGKRLIRGIQKMQNRFKQIGDVRGLGLMVGVEFTDSEGKPDKASAKAVIDACLQEKLLLISCGPWSNTIRFIPPLIVSSSQIDDGLSIFERALEKALQ